jgi:hypothetical protein
MEAIAGFSLACNVFQVVDFGYTIIKGSIQLAHAVEEGLPEHSSGLAIATDLRELLVKIKSPPSNYAPDPQLARLCDNCDSIAEELIAILISLKPIKKRQAVSKAIRSQWNKEKVEALERRLDRFRDEILAYINVNFQ